VSQIGELGYVYRFVEGDLSSDGLTLLLLHGTGGDESDLIPLGQTLAPGAALLSPRGRVSENGMPRFFRRIAEGVFDQQDLRLQTENLAQFIDSAVQAYTLRPDRIVAVGYSNGANIASSVVLTRPHVLATAVLFRPMVPFVPPTSPNLEQLDLFVAAGRRDTIAGPHETERLVQIFKNAGATVTTYWHNGGHELGQDDLVAATSWVSEWRKRP
jgi:phospholipase/carboxylesterase/glyoxalase family protein